MDVKKAVEMQHNSPHTITNNNEGLDNNDAITTDIGISTIDVNADTQINDDQLSPLTSSPQTAQNINTYDDDGEDNDTGNTNQEENEKQECGQCGELTIR
eukprot:794987_1